MFLRQTATTRTIPHLFRAFSSGQPPAPVLVDGCRIPFLTSGTGYKSLIAHELGRLALLGLVNRNALDTSSVDRIIMGTVIQESKTSNIAREAALGAGFPLHVPAFTVTMACISSNQAIASAVDFIRSGQGEIVIASGTETMSDVPIRFSKAMRERMLSSQKIKSLPGYLKLLKGFKLKDLAPELPAIAEYSTGETMGRSADRLAATFGVSRREQDEFALRSHHLAAEAHAKGVLNEEIISTKPPPNFDVIEIDNGVRGESTLEKISTLKPAFIKPHGTITAANASFLTDGASATLIMSEKRAKENGLTPKAHFKDYIFVAQDPQNELLMGPAYAIAKLLKKNNLTLNDIDVFEIHEAFAAQVLANLNALDSEKFCREKLGLDRVGRIPIDKLNVHGGSLSLGHPFGATGCRLVTTAANRLKRENGKLALVAACAAGGLGHAMLLERRA